MPKLSVNKLEELKWQIRQAFHNYAEGVVFELQSIIWGIALRRLLEEYGEENKEAIIDILNRPQNDQRMNYRVEAGPWYYGIRPSLKWTWAVEEIRPEIEEYVLGGKIPTELAPVLLTPNILRNTIAENLANIESGLTVFTEKGGTKGIEYRTNVGPIDILTRDEKDDFVVIEVKSGRADESALGQLLKYMGWVRQNLANEHNTRGIIVAEQITEGLKIGASEHSHIKLFRYNVPRLKLERFRLSFEQIAPN
jgi:Endonuclease NucS